MLGAGALGRPRGMVWGGRSEEGSGWGTHVYLWQIHFDIWQNQYNIVKFKNKIKFKKKKKTREFQKNIYLCFIDYTKALDCVDHNKLWKTLKEVGIPDHLTCLLRNLYTGQE